MQETLDKRLSLPEGGRPLRPRFPKGKEVMASKDVKVKTEAPDEEAQEMLWQDETKESNKTVKDGAADGPAEICVVIGGARNQQTLALMAPLYVSIQKRKDPESGIAYANKRSAQSSPDPTSTPHTARPKGPNSTNCSSQRSDEPANNVGGASHRRDLQQC